MRKEIYLIIKNGTVIPHTDLAAMEAIDGVKTPEKTVSVAAWEAAGGRAFIDGDGIIQLGIPAAERARQEETATLEAEEKALLDELAAKDYQIIKNAEQGKALADVDPVLHQRRQDCRSRIDEIRSRLAELNAAV